MTEDQEKALMEVHDYLLKPLGPNKPSRAEQIDDALAGLRAGKFFGRIVLWSCGFFIAIMTVVTQLKGGQ